MSADPLVKKLDALRAELADLAFTLECRGHCDAADIALEISGRVALITEEFADAKMPVKILEDGEPCPK